MPKKKDGTKVSWKEFFILWKEGIKNITPKQKLQNDSQATFISFIGYLVGFISMIVFLKNFPTPWLAYGLILIFFGSAYSSFTKFLMVRQQLRYFQSAENNSINLSDILDKLQEEDKK